MNIHVDNTSISTTMNMIDVDMKSPDNSDSDTTCYGSNVKKFVDSTSSDTTSSASSSVDLGARKLVMEDFHFVQRLGNGDIGTVYLVELKAKKGCYFAAKVMDKEELVYRKKECRAGVEKMILQMLDHPFCPSLYATLDCPRWSCLLTEFCPGGDLHILRQRQPDKRFAEDAVRLVLSCYLIILLV